MDIKNLLQNILDIAYDKYINLIKVYSQTDFNVTINNLKEKDETDFEQDEDTIFPGLIVNATTYEDSADTYIINFYMLNADLSRTDVLTSIVDLVRSSQYDLSIKVIEKKDTKLTNINCYNNTHEIFVNSASMKLKIVHKSCTCTTNTKPRLVTSVNGQTGDVFLPDYKGAVTSVNGQVGDVDIFIPTKTSDLVNDSDFATNEETDAKLETKQDNLIYYKEFTDEAYAHVQIPNGGQVIVDSNKAQVSYGPKGVIINDAGVMIFDRWLQDSIAGKNWTTNLIDETFYVIDSSIKNIEEILEGKQEKIDGFYQDGMVTELKPNDTLPFGGKLVVATMGAALEYEDNEETIHSIRVLNNGAFYDNKEIALKDDIVDAYTKAETNKLLNDSSVYNAGKYATIDSLNTFITEQHNVDESQNTAIDGITTDLSNLETTVTGLADDVLDISTKVKTLDSSYLDLHLTNIDDLGKQAIKDIVGAGDAYTKEETDNLFTDSSVYNNNKFVTKVNGVFNNCKDSGVSFVTSYTDTDSFKLNTGKYWKQNATTNDPYALTFTKIDNGQRNNGTYVFTRGNIYANSAGFLTNDINDSRLVKYPELKTLSDKVDDLQLFKFPNVTIFGEPTIQNGQVSDFSAESYLQFPFLVDFRNQAFEIHMCFTTGDNVNTQENIFDSVDGLAFAVRNGHFVVAMSSNGTAWDMGEHVGSYTVLPNTTYYVKFTWNKLQYKLEYSTNKEQYTTDIQVTDTRSLYAKQIIIGKSVDNTHIFGGSINLNNCYLYIMGNLVWSGMDDAGLATRLATDLSNVDEAGKEKIKEIAGGGDKLNHYKEYTIGTPEDGTVVETAKIYDTEESIENFFMGYMKEKYYEEGEETESMRYFMLQDVNEETGATSIGVFNSEGIQLVNNIDGDSTGVNIYEGEVDILALNDIVLNPRDGKVKIGEDEVATKTYVDSKIGDINTILETI